MSCFISLCHHERRAIGVHDFRGLKAFEQAYPELYRTAPTPRARDNVDAIVTQMNAFNAVFGSRWKDELSRHIALSAALDNSDDK